jgi:hypothetical protein
VPCWCCSNQVADCGTIVISARAAMTVKNWG